jgi:hypothetical protein
MALKDTLNYLLLSEYLNPQTLQKPQKEQSKYKKIYETTLDKFTDDFWHYLKQMKSISDLANNAKKHTFGIEIYGGIFELDEIGDEIIKQNPNLQTSEFRQSSNQKATSYFIKFIGNLSVKNGVEKIRLSELAKDPNFSELDVSDFELICGENSGFNVDLNSVFLSTAPWATANFNKPQNLDYKNFEELRDSIKTQIDALGKNERSLEEMVKFIHAEFKKQLNSPLMSDKFRIHICLENSVKNSNDLLNSFYIEEIGLALKNGLNNKNLQTIFNETDENMLKMDRLDMRDSVNFDHIFSMLEPKNYPLGAFASEYMLIYSQQIAVNNIMKLFNERKGGIYSVNGPPGTGKTTLLKDVIAGVIVERAKVLATLKEDEIFERGVKLDGSQYPDFYPLNEKLKGFEIVVASCNNKAVENISAELPKLDSVDKVYLEELDYFRLQATRLLSFNQKDGFKSQIAQPAWGLICATLGNSGNVGDFKENCLNDFFISQSHPEFDVLKMQGAITSFNDKFKVDGLVNLLKFGKQSYDFKLAQKEFNEALNTVNTLLALLNFSTQKSLSAQQSKEERENSSPFMADNGIKTAVAHARINVFIKALNLHKAVIWSRYREFGTNLSAFCDLGKFKKKDDAREILKSLFFVVPVISSTFASFGRFFSDFGESDIGLLLVDESGQANISNAVGVLYRSKMAVIVGDPLQLEPVVTLPENLNDVLLSYTGALKEFNVATTSLQTCADKTQKIGAYIGQTWVGSPLIVHRRCDNPMFDIANETTYDNAMVWGKGKNKASLNGVKSCWIDIKTSTWNGNSSDAELMAADQIYKSLKSIIGENASEQIKAITPFTDVVKASANLQRQGKMEIKANTIHTMQGQEAKVVIFILGGASVRARAWASAKPNLLNVALTRAKEYIYIVGDKDAWGELDYFSVAAREL